MKLRKLLVLGAAAGVFALASCGSETTTTPSSPAPSQTEDTPAPSTPADTRTYKEKVLDAFNELKTGVASTGFNAYTATFDEFVAKLKADGIITSTEEPVNMNTEDGYIQYNAPKEELPPITIADEAFAYGDVCVFHWDLATSEALDNYFGLKNNGSIVIMGGAALVPASATAEVKGGFAVSFKSVVDAEAACTYDAEVDEDWAAYQTRKGEVVAAAKTELGDRYTKLKNLTANPTKLSDCLSADELAMVLKDCGVLKMTDIVAKEDLNGAVEYDTTNWKAEPIKGKSVMATQAFKYGKVSILYFDKATNDPIVKKVFADLTEDKSSCLYAKPLYTSNDLTEIEDTAFTVDALEGQFAICVED